MRVRFNYFCSLTYCESSFLAMQYNSTYWFGFALISKDGIAKQTIGINCI